MNTDHQLSVINNDNTEQAVELSTDDRQKVELYKSKIDLNNSSNVIQYAASSQNQMVTFSEEVLRQVRTKDMGAIGDILAGLATDLKTFDKAINKKSFFAFLDTYKKKIIRIKAEYTKVEKNVASVEIQMERHYQTLLKDVNLFDKLFQQNQLYFKDLSLYIYAGEEKLKEVQEVILPKLKEEAAASNDQQQIQAYKDIEQQVNRFEKKVHDLKLSRMISLQLAPQIRLVQNNSMALMEKIQSSIVNTLPLWKNQMVLALGIVHSQQALEAQRAVTDATNQMLQRNSEMLRDSTLQIATESERGIVDLETLQKVNADLFATLDDLMRVQQEGREKRLAAEIELRNAEKELRERLLGNR